MPNTYIALTIGPIVDTLLSARKTRELWASSYFFSYIMRETVKKLKALESLEVILPSPSLIDQPNLLGAGLYPDRIYVKCKNGEPKQVFEEVQKGYIEVIDETAQKIHNDFTQLNEKRIGAEAVFKNVFDLKHIQNCLNSYIKLYCANVEVNDGENIVEKLSTVCDTLDLQPRIVSREVPISTNEDGYLIDADHRDPLKRLFYLANWSFLFEDGFGLSLNKDKDERSYSIEAKNELKKDEELKKLVSEKPKKGFDSIIEIASRELKFFDKNKYDTIITKKIKESYKNEKEEDETEESIIQEFRKTFGKQFNDYHKYIAVVHADGDNIGKIIQAIGRNQDKIDEFSGILLRFASTATRIIASYGGAPIYMGGDDMLFLAPVCNTDNSERKNIFNLIDNLDKSFNDLISKKFKNELDQYYINNNISVSERKYPTLSYGISITYYKFPLYEAKNISFSLMQKAKDSSNKNCIQVQLMKHSGQSIPFTIEKDEKIWKSFIEFMKKHNASVKFLNSFTYKLNTLLPIIESIAGESERLETFFKNSFNENYDNNKSFYEGLAKFINDLYVYQNKSFGEIEHMLLFGALRFVHFIHNNK